MTAAGAPRRPAFSAPPDYPGRFIVLEGIDGALTVCAPPKELDPTPCVSASDVTVESRLAHFDADGTLRFIDQLMPPDAAALAASARRLVVPLSVAGQQLATLDWDLQFETPKDLELAGERSGGAGPADQRFRIGEHDWVVPRALDDEWQLEGCCARLGW